jgi:hypothetical protein
MVALMRGPVSVPSLISQYWRSPAVNLQSTSTVRAYGTGKSSQALGLTWSLNVIIATAGRDGAFC